MLKHGIYESKAHTISLAQATHALTDCSQGQAHIKCGGLLGQPRGHILPLGGSETAALLGQQRPQHDQGFRFRRVAERSRVSDNFQAGNIGRL